ncbi:hypothetical protein [Rossellomorea sp. y25]|uniref:hypothetical protein n=1 Tax=Rossellomorea sp. y25 TaxID=3118174 RepID=UPI002622DB03|nr:hypothetical protein [uncultured Rossellomorea sp.]
MFGSKGGFRGGIYEVAEMMSTILGDEIQYPNPSVKEFTSYMVKKGGKVDFVNVVIGIHFSNQVRGGGRSHT